MEFETGGVTERPRPWLLALLGIAVVALVAFWLWPASSVAPAAAASNQARAAQQLAAEQADPSELDVRLERLNAMPPRASPVERNLFRFQPKAPPPAAGPTVTRLKNPPAELPEAPPPPAASSPPPIPLKFIGIVEKQGMKVAALSDCRSTFYGSEGQIIDGRYRLVRIGVESMVIEYVDGAGRTTVRLEGCPAR